MIEMARYYRYAIISLLIALTVAAEPGKCTSVNISGCLF